MFGGWAKKQARGLLSLACLRYGIESKTTAKRIMMIATMPIKKITNIIVGIIKVIIERIVEN